MTQDLQLIVKNLNTKEFVLDNGDELFSEIYLGFIRVKDFENLFRNYHILFNSTKKHTRQKQILKEEEAVYKELAKHLKNLIAGINSKATKIIFPYKKENEEQLNKTLTKLFKIDSRLTFEEKIREQTLRRLRQQLKETNQAIFELRNFQFATFKNEEFIGGNFYLRFPKELIIYKDVCINKSRYGSSVLTKDESHDNDKISLLNILAFLQASPNFLLTKNQSYNEKLTTIYNEFDILDLITLTSSKFFSTPKSKFRSLSTPIFKLQKETNFTIIPEVNDLELFHLYHSSLKQIEPLPRCVFLFRMVEYGKNYHYQPTFKPKNIELKDIIEYYYSKAIKHKFIPLFFLDYGSDWDLKADAMIKRRKKQYLNLLTELKKKSKQILKKWDNNPYLRSKSLGEIIYNTGRNTVAHGGNGRQNINYDYANKYKHINDVNVFLELISRYLIEIHNPKLKSIVHKQKEIYEMNCSHMKMMKEKEQSS